MLRALVPLALVAACGGTEVLIIEVDADSGALDSDGAVIRPGPGDTAHDAAEPEPADPGAPDAGDPAVEAPAEDGGRDAGADRAIDAGPPCGTDDTDRDGVPDGCDSCPESPNYDVSGREISAECEELLWSWDGELALDREPGLSARPRFVLCLDATDSQPCYAESIRLGYGALEEDRETEDFYPVGESTALDEMLAQGDFDGGSDGHTLHIGYLLDPPYFQIESAGPFDDQWTIMRTRTVTRLRRIHTLKVTEDAYLLKGRWEIYGYWFE